MQEVFSPVICIQTPWLTGYRSLLGFEMGIAIWICVCLKFSKLPTTFNYRIYVKTILIGNRHQIYQGFLCNGHKIGFVSWKKPNRLAYWTEITIRITFALENWSLRDALRNFGWIRAKFKFRWETPWISDNLSTIIQCKSKCVNTFWHNWLMPWLACHHT